MSAIVDGFCAYLVIGAVWCILMALPYPDAWMDERWDIFLRHWRGQGPLP